jgi:small basic protein
MATNGAPKTLLPFCQKHPVPHLVNVRLSAGEVRLAVAIGAKSDQVFGSIVAKRTTRTNMVHLKAFRGSAILAAPAISLQHIGTKLAVGIRIESKPRFSLPNRFHAVFPTCRRNSTF